MVFFLATQLALVMLAREASRLFAVEEKKAEAREEPQPEPAEEPVEAQVAGFAWMRAAGVTHPDKMCVRTTTIRARHAILPPALRLFSNDPIASPSPRPRPPLPGRPADPSPLPHLDPAQQRERRAIDPRQIQPRRHGRRPESPLVPPTPFSPASRASSHYASLSPGELQKLREFRGLLERAAKADPELLSTPALRRFCSDSTLCRYLRARRWNLKRALKMLVSSLRWRRAARPDSITWEDVAAEGTSGKQYVTGRDQQGRNVLVMRPGRENTREHAGNIRFLVYTLERAAWRDSPAEDPPLGSYVDHASEKLVILIDFTGWTLATAPPMKTSRETLSILQDHYPERLAVAVCHNAPFIFALFWKAISPFIDPETSRKIRFVNPKRKKRCAACSRCSVWR